MKHILLPSALRQGDGSEARSMGICAAFEASLGTTLEDLNLPCRKGEEGAFNHVMKHVRKYVEEGAVIVEVRGEAWHARQMPHRLLADGSLCLLDQGHWVRAYPDGKTESATPTRPTYVLNGDEGRESFDPGYNCPWE